MCIRDRVKTAGIFPDATTGGNVATTGHPACGLLRAIADESAPATATFARSRAKDVSTLASVMQLPLPRPKGKPHETTNCRRHPRVLLLQTGSVLLLGRMLLQRQEIVEEAPKGAAMTLALAILLAMHGLIHMFGATKGFRLSMAGGSLWLAGGALFFLTAVALVAWPRGWWAIGAVALAISVLAIVPSWSEAKFGMVPNALILAAVVAGFMSEGPVGLHACLLYTSPSP